jgi:hypothetical protein
MITSKRIFMAEQDTGGGNGAAAPVAPATTENVSQAQGAPAITKEMSDAIAATVSKAVADVKDSIFAEARRTFTEKKNKPKDESPATPPPSVDAHDERRVLRDFDRSLTRLGLQDKVSSAQWSRAEKALLAERPDDVSAWVKDYFEGYGAAISPAPSTPAAPVAAPSPQNERPASDRGSPRVSQVPLEQQRLQDMSQADRDALIKQKGLPWYRQKLMDDLRGASLSAKG